MFVGKRIIFDQDGDIIFETGEMSGDVSPRKEITSLQVVDLSYGEIPSTHRIVKIDIETKQPILEEIPVVLTEEQVKIQQLENELLLMTDATTGGIL